MCLLAQPNGQLWDVPPRERHCDIRIYSACGRVGSAPCVQASRAGDSVAALPAADAQQLRLWHLVEAQHAGAELKLTCGHARSTVSDMPRHDMGADLEVCSDLLK